MLVNDKLNLTMLCDFYELTMGNGYFENGYKDRICYFDVFYRRCPDNGGFAIMAGLEQLINFWNSHMNNCLRLLKHGLSASGAESALSPLSLIKNLNLVPLDLLIFSDHELGDSFTRIHYERLI